MADEIVIRDARTEDNQVLIDLDRQCVMGGTVELAFDRSPDFFARSRAYESFRLCVAERRGTIIGVGGVTVKCVRVAGVVDRWAYFYDLRVSPAYRQRGVARLIADVLGQTVREAGITKAYAWVVEGNTASESFVERRGSLRGRRCTLALVAGPAGATPHGFDRIPARDEAVAALLDATYRPYDFTPSWDAAALERTVERLTPLGWQGLYGKRGAGTWSVCFGLWDYSRVMQIVEVGGSSSPGALRPFFLYPLGWRDRDALREGLRAARAMVADRGGTLLVPYGPGDPAGAWIPGDAVRIGMTQYLRGMPPDALPRDGPVFIDPADL